MSFSFTAKRFTGSSVEKDDIQDSLDEVEAFLNAPTLDEKDVLPQELSYRHLARPPRYGYSRVDGTNVPNGYTIDNVSYGGWYAAIPNAIKHTSVLSSTPNLASAAARPVVLVVGRAYMSMMNGSWWGGGGNLITRMTIGYSTNNMATWAGLADPARSFGPTKGGAREYYNGVLQPHYWLAPPATIGPPNVIRDPPLTVVAGFGGLYSEINPTTITHYTLMFDSPTMGANCFPWFELEVWARDEE